MILIIIFGDVLYKLKLFPRQAKPVRSLIFNPLNHDAAQSVIKLNINKQTCCYGCKYFYDFANKLFIIKKRFLISIYNSVQNSRRQKVKR